MTTAEKMVLEAEVVSAALACHLTRHGAHILLSMLESAEEAAKLLDTLAKMREASQ